MSAQTYNQRHAQQAYCAVQREERTQPWHGEGVGYTPAVPEPELEQQPASWADAAPFLCVLSLYIGFLAGLSAAGVL
ncbi:hypothetical protein FHW84_001791 [Dyella sp. SG562]|uniref:hypothetical protein n=1 Tax=Dyella sp. SG562 TaxID=2587017 RepID=UPI0014205771|nr:hypothetical protein [Dyella sp. SG562]NII73222.1 hypothetical protein [Dyella sp. SG562]